MIKYIIILMLSILPLCSESIEDDLKELEQEIKECWKWESTTSHVATPHLKIACQMAVRNRIEILKLRMKESKK